MKKIPSGERLYKAFLYLVLLALVLTILVPVGWVFLASIKTDPEFYTNPWNLPISFYWQNFVRAWNTAQMGQYLLNSVIVTAMALDLLLVVALPAAYCLSRFRFRGHYLQLASALGVEKETGFTLNYDKYNWQIHPEHFILADSKGEVDFGEGRKGICAPQATTVYTDSSSFGVTLAPGEFRWYSI